MAVFPLLLDAAAYRACEVDLLRDAAARAYWLDLFVSQFEHQAAAAVAVGIEAARCAAARADLRDEIEMIRRDPTRHGRLDVLRLDEVRRAVLARHGIRDEFRAIKTRENEAALAEVARWLRDLDAAPDDERFELLARGILAGNLFDMGAAATAGPFAGGDIGFADALARVPERPWFVDDLERAVAWLGTSVPSKVVVFADNTGSDLLLGVLPLARALLASGSRVVITANAEPSLNDVTIDELSGLVHRFGRAVGGLDRDRLRLVDSGSSSPLIDLTDISPALAEAARDAELLILFGMGRGIESNWTARFRCATWRLAMIKDPQVARTIGAEMFDAVCRFDWPAGPP